MWASRYVLPVVLVAVLAGCTSAPIPDPSPTAPVPSSPVSPVAPTPDATDEATVVTALVIRATTLTSYARGSVPVTSWHYRDTSTADVVAGLTSLLGAPETTPNGDSGGAEYDWGGCRLESLTAADAPPATISPLIHRWRVVVDAPTVG